MAEFELHYFPLRGRAEVPRLLLAETKTEYKEIAVVYADMKKDTETYLFGQCPLLVDKKNDLNLAQSNSICRHIARTRGKDLLGKTAKEEALIDMWQESAEEWRVGYLKIIYGGNYEADLKKHLEGAIDKWPALFEAQFKRNGNTGYLVGHNLSIVDFHVYELFDVHLKIAKDLGTKYPLLQKFHDEFEKRPAIHEHLKNRLAKINGNGLGQ